MVLFIVILVIAMLTLAGFAFVSLMETERDACSLQGRELQSQSLASSGETLLCAAIALPRPEQDKYGGLLDNQRRFAAQPVLIETAGEPFGRFSILSPRVADGRVAGVRYGLANESAKLNLAVVLQWERAEPGSGRKALMSLPGMTGTMADSILDWCDGDDDARPMGGESSYYKQQQGLPYTPRNGPPACLEELLLIRDVNREMLFGRDEDLNYLPDGGGSAISGFGDTGLQGGDLPWLHLLTVHSAERNVASDGRPRIDLNQQDLRKLHAELTRTLGKSWADFIVLYRQFGPAKSPVKSTTASARSGPSSLRSSNSSSSRSRGERTPAPDLSLPARFKLNSPLDLIGVRVQIPSPRARTSASVGSQSPRSGAARPPIVVGSPIAASRAHRGDDAARLLDATTTDSAPVTIGRVNVNEAPEAVLLAIPGLEDSDVRQIVSRRARATSSSANARRHPTWLWAEDIVDLPTMKRILPCLTCGGDVYRAQIVGYFENEATAFSRVEVVLDGSSLPPTRVYYKDLTLLGRGFDAQTLMGGASSSSSTATSTAGMPSANDPLSSLFGGNEMFSLPTPTETNDPMGSSWQEPPMDDSSVPTPWPDPATDGPGAFSPLPGPMSSPEEPFPLGPDDMPEGP